MLGSCQTSEGCGVDRGCRYSPVHKYHPIPLPALALDVLRYGVTDVALYVIMCGAIRLIGRALFKFELVYFINSYKYTFLL